MGELKYHYQQSGNVFSILEVGSGWTVTQSDNASDVRAIYRNLKRGGGFNGETPEFFTRTAHIKKGGG